MRRLSPALALLALASAALAGCVAAPSSAPTGPSSPSSTPSASALPDVEPQIVVDLDGLTLSDGDGVRRADFDEPESLLSLLEEATGTRPAPEEVEVFPGEESTLESYRWDGLWVTADSSGQTPAFIAVTAAELAGIPVVTDSGLQVGSPRADLLAAGAWALVDEEDAATAEALGLGGEEVEGTESLTRPGSVGIAFTLFQLDGDTVTQIQVPSNDFTDV